MKIPVCILFLCIPFSFQGQELSIYVSPSGYDINKGSLEKPLATITAALKKLRGLPNRPVSIYLRQGYYSLSESILLDSETVARHPLTIAGYKDEKVIVSGGKQLSTEKFHLVKDPVILQRLAVNARNNVYETSMDEQAITDFGNRVPHGFARETLAPLELFFNNDPLTLARWPNTGFLSIGKVLDQGSIPRSGTKENRGAQFMYDFDRPSGWKNKNDIWLYGIFAHSYADDNVPVESIDEDKKIIKLLQASYYGISGNEENKNAQTRGYYFYNILEELDSAGEWFLDKNTHKLYIWPPSPIRSASVSVSMIAVPLLILYQVRDITIKNIQFSFGRGPGLYAAGTTNVLIDDCTFMDFGAKAITMEDPGNVVANNKNVQKNKDLRQNSKFVINNCSIYNTGTGAISMSGGDRKNLIPAENAIKNCNIYNYSRINRASPPAITMSGAGNIITHCFIHNASSAAINYSGNNHEMSFNHIMLVASEFSDIGAVYTGRDPSSTGNKIIGNFFDSIQSKPEYAVAAVYMDDGSGGMEVSGNIFYKCGNLKKYGAVHINGGADNKFYNNYFIECPKAFSNTVWDDQKWKLAMYRPDMM